MNNSFKKVLIKFLITICVLALVVIVFYSTYFFSVNKSYSKYKKQISSIVTEINSTNDKIANLCKGTYSAEVLTESLPTNLKILNEQKSLLTELKPTEKYSKSYDYLLKGLKNNITTYNYLLNLLKSPLSDTDVLIDKIKHSQEECSTSYSLFTMDDIKIQFSSSNITLINDSLNYVYEQKSLKRDKDITQKQLLTFDEKLQETLSTFMNIKTNYSSDLNKVRENLSTYDKLSAKIESDSEKLKDIKEKFYNISVPTEHLKLYNSLKLLLDTYGEYIENFSYSLTIEKMKVKDKHPSEKSLNSLYKTANNKISDLEINYDNFISLYKEFKKSIY